MQRVRIKATLPFFILFELFKWSNSQAVQTLVGRTGNVVPGVSFAFTTSAGGVWDDQG